MVGDRVGRSTYGALGFRKFLELPKLIYNLARRLALHYIKPIAKLGK